jgi:NADPH-dependent glutamate synthase beta subunit-like oxidoreductase
MAGHGSPAPPDRARHPGRQVGREMFTAVDRDTGQGMVEAAEFPSTEATGQHGAMDYAYWMNSANAGQHYQVRH